LDAALKVFSDQGFAAAKMADIANAAGVGKGTIYEYYQSKEDLFFAVFRWYVDEVVASGMLDAARLEGDEADRLRAFLDSAVNSGVETLEYFAISLEFWAAAGSPATRDRFRKAMQALYQSFRAALETLLEDGKRSGVFRKHVDSASVAAGLTGALDGLLLQGWMDGHFDIRGTARGFLDTIMLGMRNTE